MRIKITYLDNSGFLAETENYNLIFDYYNLKSEQKKGVIAPEELKRKKTFVFVSHAHYDHYNPKILNELKNLDNITYVFSNDVKTKDNVFHADPDKSYKIGGIEFSTLRSTDEGVAFLIKADGAVIYHAGDLNWWDWEGEPKDWLSAMERDFKSEIRKLSGVHINVAFAPIDPRLEHNMGKGARFLIDTADVDLLVPMHYRGAYKQAGEFIQSNFRDEEKTFVIKPLKPGESIIYEQLYNGVNYEFEVSRYL